MRYLCLFLTWPLVAQISGLATNYTGSDLFFTSTWRQRGTDQPTHGKIFRLNDREMKAELVVPMQRATGVWYNYYSANLPFLDEQGQLVGYQASRTCIPPVFASQQCRLTEGALYRGQPYDAQLFFSPNGRYAISAQGSITYSLTLLDFATNPPQVLTNAIFAAKTTNLVVTNQGHAYQLQDNRLVRLAEGETKFAVVAHWERTDATLEADSVGLALSADESHAYAWQANRYNGPSQLFDVDLVTGTPQALGEPRDEYCDSLRTLPNGDLLAGCRRRSGEGARLLRFKRAENTWQSLENFIGGVREWTLSGDSNVIWYLTPSLAFHKYTFSDRTDVTYLPPMGALDAQYFVVPNGDTVIPLKGAGLATYRPCFVSGGVAQEIPVSDLSDERMSFLLTRAMLGVPGSYIELFSAQPALFELRHRVGFFTGMFVGP